MDAVRSAAPQQVDQSFVDRLQSGHLLLQLLSNRHHRLRRFHECFIVLSRRFQLLTERRVLCLQLLRRLNERGVLCSQLVVELEGLLEMVGELRDVNYADILHAALRKK